MKYAVNIDVPNDKSINYIMDFLTNLSFVKSIEPIVDEITLASEEALAKDWLLSCEEEAWKDL
jgi:hypothetical protein